MAFRVRVSVGERDRFAVPFDSSILALICTQLGISTSADSPTLEGDVAAGRSSAVLLFNDKTVAEKVCSISELQVRKLRCSLKFSPDWEEREVAPVLPEVEGNAIETVVHSPHTRATPFQFVKTLKLPLEAEPILHDLFRHDLISGRLCLEFSNLTPMLCGNEQYEYAHLKGDRQQLTSRIMAIRENEPLRNDEKSTLAKKHVIEPLILSIPGIAHTVGPVLVPGTQLDGMLHGDLASLFSSPMERVRERTFSHRPNLTLSPADDDLLESLCGVVTEVMPNGDLLCRFPMALSELTYVDRNAFGNLLQCMGISDEDLRARFSTLASTETFHAFSEAIESLKLTRNALDCELKPSRGRSKLFRQVDKVAAVAGRCVLPYRFGLDGQGKFDRNGGVRYPLVLADLSGTFGGPVTIPVSLIRQRQQTNQHLISDSHGHLLAHPIIKSAGQKKIVREAMQNVADRDWKPGDVFFFERSPSGEVLSMGHHFRYRDVHRSSIHKKHNGRESVLRDILCPAPCEVSPRSPQRLTLTRRLFGYVGTSTQQYSATEPLTYGIGWVQNGDIAKPTDFHQLAGRLTFNMATEVLSPDNVDLKKRFLNPECNFVVPLRPLASPKASAVEHYLQQDSGLLNQRNDQGILVTYSESATDIVSGELNGRKAYLHQPDAGILDRDGSPTEKARSCYELLQPQQIDRAGISQNDEKNWRKQEARSLVASDQASFAKFVSKPNRKFRVALNFHNLERWEFGAVLLCVISTPKLWLDFAEAVEEKFTKRPLHKWISRWREIASAQGAPLLAQKLGHGRPLGMGSISFNEPKILRVVSKSGLPVELTLESDDELVASAVRAFAEFLKAKLSDDELDRWCTEVCLKWLQVHRYAGRTRFDFPRGPSNEGPSVFAYHTELRKKHAAGRKNSRQASTIHAYGLASLDKLDAEDQERLGR